MPLSSRTLLPLIVSCALLSGCPGDSPPDSGESASSDKASAVPEAAGCGIDTAERLVNAKPILTDIDGDSGIERVLLFRNRTSQNQEFPLLVRWDPRPDSQRRRDAVWAVATQVVVKLRPGVNPEQVWESWFLDQDVDFLPSSERTFLVRISPQRATDLNAVNSLLSTLSELRRDERVAWAEPDYLLFLDVDIEPNDAKFSIGNFRKAFVKVQSLAAWDTETGFEGIRVAVIDTGIDAAHPDLQPNFIAGFNVIDNNTNTDDDHGHGSYCAGLVGAQGNDGIGMTGVNWNVSLMPVKAFDKTGCGTSERAAKAIRFAVNHCADVISASWGGLGNSTDLKQAIEQAKDKGILFVASAGNSPSDLNTQDYFPATYNIANMIVVGASNVVPGDPQDDTKIASSGHGTVKVHLSAPGNDLSSAWPTRFRPRDPYNDKSGTSPAVALVAGTAALVKAKNRNFTLGELRCRILKATDRITPALDKASCSGGRLNVEKAVKGTGLRANVCGCP